MGLDLLIARNQDMERRLAEMETVEGGGGGGLTVTTYSADLGSNHNNNTATFADVTNSGVSHTFTRANALILATFRHGTTSADFAEVRIVCGSITGSKVAKIKGNIGEAVMLPDVFDVSALSGAQTIKLQHRQTVSGTSYVAATVLVQYAIIEYD